MSDFLHNAPRDVFVRALRSESADRGYTDLGARISLYLDVDAGRVRALSAYARQWGWPKGTLYKRWKEVTRDVWNWCSSHGRQPERSSAQRYLELVPPTSKAAFVPEAAAPGAPEIEEPAGNAQETFGNAGETKNGDSGPLSGCEETVGERFGNGQETHTHHPIPSTSISSNEKTDICPSGPADSDPLGESDEEDSGSDAGEDPTDRPSQPAPRDRLQQAIASWNGFVDVLEADRGVALPSVFAENDKRKAAIRQRWEKVWPNIEQIYAEVRRSSFLMGTQEGSSWTVNFDFVWCRTDGWSKILEGTYRDQPNQHAGRRKESTAERFARIYRIAEGA